MACLDSIAIIWGNPCVNLLGYSANWASFPPSMSTFSFCTSPGTVIYLINKGHQEQSTLNWCKEIRILKGNSHIGLGTKDIPLMAPVIANQSSSFNGL